ncbi:MAG: hypothetical protein WBF77_01640 [Sulfurimonadaceae bacterium]
MFSFFRNLIKSSNQIVYIRFTRDKISFYYYPSDVRYEDEPILAIKKKGKKEIVSAVGKEIKDLKPEDTSIVHTPFKPFLPEPENFDLGEKVIRYLMQKGATFKGSLDAPRVIIHPDKSYVSEMEAQAYRELALSAGAREAVVYVGDELSVDEIEGVMQNR